MLTFLLGALTFIFFFLGGWMTTIGFPVIGVVSCLGGLVSGVLIMATKTY